MNQVEVNNALNAAFNSNKSRAQFSLLAVGEDRFDVVIRYGSPDAERAKMLVAQVLGAQLNECRLSRPL